MREPLIQAKRAAGEAVLSTLLAGCLSGSGPSEGGGSQTPAIAITLPATAVLALQNGTPAAVDAAIERSGGNTNSVTRRCGSRRAASTRISR